MPHQQRWQPESLIHELFGPDFVLPEQFYGSNDTATRFSGERALMWAVFADGVECYRRNAAQLTQEERVEFRDADRWMRANNWDWAFSFVNLCETFGFSPAAVRRALRRSHQEANAGSMRRRRFRPITLHAAA